MRRLMIKTVITVGAKSLMNKIARKMMRSDLMQAWTFEHGMFRDRTANALRFHAIFLAIFHSIRGRADSAGCLAVSGKRGSYDPIDRLHRSNEESQECPFINRSILPGRSSRSALSGGNIPLVLRTIGDRIQARETADLDGQ